MVRNSIVFVWFLTLQALGSSESWNGLSDSVPEDHTGKSKKFFQLFKRSSGFQKGKKALDYENMDADEVNLVFLPIVSSSLAKCVILKSEDLFSLISSFRRARSFSRQSLLI